MYFERFPKTLYSLDDRDTVQAVTNITLRVVLSDEIKNNLSAYDEYDIREGETPEILADIMYNNPQLHWIILHVNDILDPRFDWPLSQQTLYDYTATKYTDINGIHHYEDNEGLYVTGNVIMNSSGGFSNFYSGNVISNSTNSGTGVIVSKTSNSNVTVLVSSGGFKTGDQITLFSNANVAANITSTISIVGTPVTNLVYEEEVNETKRRIKILKPQYLDAVISEFNSKLEIT
jgi:hypothetical protein